MNLNQLGRASIIILTKDGLEYTRQCLDSIFLKTTYPDYEIVIVDNASQDGSFEYLKKVKTEQKNIQIIRNQQNVGFSRGNNQGARAAKGEYLVFLNNDTVVTHGWLTRLIEHLQDPSIGIIGPVTNSASNEAKIPVTYETLDDLDQFAQEYTQTHHNETFEIRALAFFCVAIRTEYFQEIGPLEEKFGLGMFEDDDYAIRVKESGYRVICTEDVFVHHWGGASFLKLDPYQYWLLFIENRRKFERKWNVTWQPHLQRKELLTDQVLQLSEAVYRLQTQLLSESKLNTTDESFEIIINRVIEKEREIDWKDREIERLSWTLDEIHKSNAWKIVQVMWNVKRSLVPEDSKREEALVRFTGKTKSTQLDNPIQKLPEDKNKNETTPERVHTRNKRTKITDRHVAILASQFFDLEGKSTFIGGAERYLLELINIIRGLDYEPVVFQSAIGNWERDHKGISFYGLDSRGDNNRLNVIFHDLINADTPVIYMSFNLAAPFHSTRSIGISHGAFWDHKEFYFPEDRMKSIEKLLAPLSNLSRIVSVDTNTINWLRTVQPSLAKKSVYIPNFVDTEVFKYLEKPKQDKIVILYPRRLYPARGFWLVYDIIPEFLENYPQLEFHFVGQADSEEKAAVEELVKNYDNRVLWETMDMQAMHKAYQQADITLIPTLYSEGTSLSCLEAMAAGNAVIATNIGGLPDLVINEFNGLLIEPNANSLRDALSLLCDNQQLRDRLSKRARDVADAFTIKAWQAKWRQVLNEEFLLENYPN
jgi:GT2 family glycosyltransferase/glycosyltransferase involved in cell wall biosynthesis